MDSSVIQSPLLSKMAYINAFIDISESYDGNLLEAL